MSFDRPALSPVAVAAAPVLLQSPVPVAEPRPALRVVPERKNPRPRVPLDRAPAGPRSTGHRPAASLDDTTGGAPPAASPPIAAWARQFVQTALEAAAGRRPVSQLLRWSSDDVYALLARRASLAVRLDRGGMKTIRCSVRSVHLRPPQAGVIEACAVVSDRDRFRAVALRIEESGRRWRVTALEIG
jgi:hypothetical protein